ncbi:MAG: succinyldiaminopimelate transaminase [Pseudomonadales bacterium]|nr:succinyldiaminopimelate transaminase [Pseudomonadales bacterium]
MNNDLQRLHPYPFEKLNTLKAAVTPPAGLSPILLSIGEPKHAPPAHVMQALREALPKLAHYPATKGSPELRETIAKWLTQRFGLAPNSVDAEQHILPVNGTREALFAFTQVVVNREAVTSGEKPYIMMPNPFYQIYEGAVFLSGATPYYLPSKGIQPDFDAVDDESWSKCQLLFICSPYNPTGGVIQLETLKKLIALADKHDFIIASDECYSEVYLNETQAPVGLLEACAILGRHQYERCVVFHSLSKRSNLPGLRSGFVAGDARILKDFLLYRTYHGSAMPLHHQVASIHAWKDEKHVIKNRRLYKDKFTQFKAIVGQSLTLNMPEGGFYFWAETPIDDIDFAQRLYASENVTVLPGQYLSREINGINPGKNRVRLALVASAEECAEAAHRIQRFMKTLSI